MRLEALVRTAPIHVADLRARDVPIQEAGELVPEALDYPSVDQVDERVPQIGRGAKVNGEVHKIVAPCKPVTVEHHEEHGPRVVVREVAHHEGGVRRVGAVRAFVRARIRLRVLRNGLSGLGILGAFVLPTVFGRLRARVVMIVAFMLADRRRGVGLVAPSRSPLVGVGAAVHVEQRGVGARAEPHAVHRRGDLHELEEGVLHHELARQRARVRTLAQKGREAHAHLERAAKHSRHPLV
mmetsp:Transcript_32177/g.84997  ORF Transcript_32177/g.84997 Transcript_32177/m.84997 type:complete len:239 (-) Transcript_32177:71-787(-)